MILSYHQSWVLVLLLHSALGLNDHHLASCKTPIQARGWASCHLNHLFNGLISASDHGDCHIIDMFSKLTIAQGQGQYLNSGFSGFFCSLYYSSMPCNLGLLYFLFFFNLILKKSQHSENRDHSIQSHDLMANRWEKVETHFILLGSNITADGDCSHEIKRCLLLGRKAMTNLESVL